MKKILNILSTKQVYGTLIILFITYIIYKGLNVLVKNLVIKGKSEIEIKRKKTIVILFNNIFKYILIIFMALSLLKLYGIDTTSIIAGLGIVGVVIGMSIQDALKDIISGINIIMDNYFVVGDIVDYEGFMGTVIEFGLKTTKIKKLTGEVLSISNRNIDKIINISQEKAIVQLDIPTAYEENFDKIESVLKEVLDNSKKTYKKIDKIEFLGISSFEESCIIYSVRFRCERETQWDLRRCLLKDIKEAYDRNKIKIPYNQLEVHNGTKI